MYQKKLEADIRCPLEYGLDVFGGRWDSRIICVLDQEGNMRYGALKKEMQNITDAVLSATLKKLLNSGMITRQSFDEIPPRVEYGLTEKGKSAIPILHNICQWSKGYYDESIRERMPHYCETCCFYKEADN